MVSKKIGSIAIIILFLFLFVSGFSYIFLELDESTGLNDISNDLTDFEGSTNETTSDFKNNVIEKTDETGEFVQPEDLQVETRGSDTAGIMNKKGKNVLTSFVVEIFKKFPIPAPIQIFAFSLIAITLSILFIRFFWGDSRI